MGTSPTPCADSRASATAARSPATVRSVLMWDFAVPVLMGDTRRLSDGDSAPVVPLGPSPKVTAAGPKQSPVTIPWPPRVPPRKMRKSDRSTFRCLIPNSPHPRMTLRTFAGSASSGSPMQPAWASPCVLAQLGSRAPVGTRIRNQPSRFLSVTTPSIVHALPIYEFACRDCDHRFEELVRAAALEADCPRCGSGRTARLMSAFSVRTTSPGGNRLARAMSEPGAGAGGGCCGGFCGGH